MAVNKDPILKRCRYLGISPMVMGINKKSNRFEKAGPNRKKVSEYGMQLKEKQKLKFIYGMMETPFRHYFELAEKMEGKAGDNLITLLESRLDNVAYRMGMALTRREARQLVGHGHFTVNKFKDVVEQTNGRTTPLWLDVNRDAFSATVNRLPNPTDIDYETETHLIVELYSK